MLEELLGFELVQDLDLDSQTEQEQPAQFALGNSLVPEK